MSTFPKYETYKDSGVEWLGEVPAHWEAEKGKWLFLKMSRSVLESDGVVTAFRDGQVTLRTNRRTDGFTNAIKEHGYQGIRKGDLVIHAMDAFAGAIGVSESDGKSTPVYAACIPRKENTVSPLFYAHILRHMAHSGFITTLAKGIRERSTDFRFNDFGELYLPLPPKPEQDRIVAFLDEKTAQIDELIAKKERQIQLLDEQKAIRINQAVTRGLNPDLSAEASAKEGVKLNPSGIEWIGDIPEHWEVKRIKYISQIFRGKFTHRPRNDPSLYDGAYPFIQTGDVAKAGINITQYSQTLNEKGLRVSTLVPKGTIAITIAANIGDVAILGFDACFPDSVVGFLPKDEVEHMYFFYVLKGMKTHFLSLAPKNTQHNLNVERVGGEFIAVPPASEQAQIIALIEMLDEKTREMVDVVSKEIQSLKTLRSTLIAHAVTGKIKV